jgi:hypothetical protein
MTWLDEIPTHSQKLYASQAGQDGILRYIFDMIGRTNRVYVEFGFNVPDYFPDCGANTGYLRVHEGWTGVCFDTENENPSIGLWKERITAENVVDIFTQYNIPKDVDYVSIDIDSIDLWVFKALISSGTYRPRVISVEFNTHFELGESWSVINDPTICWKNNDWVHGASLSALHQVGAAYGYTLVACEFTLDAFFIRSDLLDVHPPDLESFRTYCNVQWANEPTPERRNLMRPFVLEKESL